MSDNHTTENSPKNANMDPLDNSNGDLNHNSNPGIMQSTGSNAGGSQYNSR
jgi:hypothetical protein